jgi:hypothetical protein
VRRVLVVAVTLLPVSACSGTSPRPGSSARPVYCTIMADPPHRDGAGQNIVSPGRFDCARPGSERLVLTVQLERQNGTAWTVVTSATSTVTGTATTRSSSPADRTRTVTSACATGLYRTTVTATSTSNGRQKNYAMSTRGTKDPCTLRSGR